MCVWQGAEEGESKFIPLNDVKIPTRDGDNNCSRTSETSQRKCITSLGYHKPGAQDSHKNATTLLINTAYDKQLEPT